MLNRIRTGPRGGPPVLLIHPVGLDLGYWGSQIDALCDDHDVIAYDLPGHGASSGTLADCDFAQAADVVAELVGWAASGPAHLVGLSVGGMIAQAAAVAHPGLVRSLTLVATSASFTDAGRRGLRMRAELTRSGGMAAVMPSTFERWFTPAIVSRRPDLMDRVRKTLLANDPAIHAAMWETIADLDLVASLPAITCPALVIVGDQDTSTPVEAARQIAGHLPHATLEVIEDVSHMVGLEAPGVLNGMLRRFLRG